MNERPGSWLPRLQEAGERLAEEWVSARRPPKDKLPQPAELRASDADRERIAQVLQDAHADGRITLEELEERLGVLYSARTLGELAKLTEDLLPADEQPLNLDGRPVSAFFRQQQRGGRWVVPSGAGRHRHVRHHQARLPRRDPAEQPRRHQRHPGLRRAGDPGAGRAGGHPGHQGQDRTAHQGPRGAGRARRRGAHHQLRG
ncbi:DUF1707 domain-containing protein [Nonomuraea ferruginea]